MDALTFDSLNREELSKQAAILYQNARLYTHLIVSALFPIFIAAHASLCRPSSAAPPKKKDKKRRKEEEGSDSEDELVRAKVEGLTAWDALTFPLLAGITLSTLYYIIKNYDITVVNKWMGYYFSLTGIYFATSFLADSMKIVRSFVFPVVYTHHSALFEIDTVLECFQESKSAARQGQEDEDWDPRKRFSPLPGVFNTLSSSTSTSKRLWHFRKNLYSKAHLNLYIHRFLKARMLIDILDFSALIIVFLLTAYQQVFDNKSWLLTNFLGTSFSYGSLQFISPTSFPIGSLILGSLFFYDIYFVFYTPMMVGVATKLDVPIKMLFPRPSSCGTEVTNPDGYWQCIEREAIRGRAHAMLGLGDIVVPGMIIAMALRYDLFLHYKRLQRRGSDSGIQVNGNIVNGTADPKYVSAEDEPGIKNDAVTKQTYLSATGSWGERFWTSSLTRSAKSNIPQHLQAKSFRKPYFTAAVIGYIAGLIITVLVMQIAQHAQPALLYLVPCVVGSLWGTALVRGELSEMWHYTEDEEESDKDKKKQKEKEKEKEKTDEEKTADEQSNGKIDKNANSKEEKSGRPKYLVDFTISMPR